MNEIAKHVPDISTFAANLVVFLAAIGAAVVGSMSMVKKIKEGWVDLAGAKAVAVAPTPPQAQVIGGLLQDLYGSNMMAEQIRDMVQATSRNTEIQGDVKDAVCENTRELRELRHQIERAMDRMDRR